MSQPNVMLTISADVSKAVKGMLDAKAGQEGLAKATKAGASAARDQAKAETGISAALDLTTASSKRAAEGTNLLREAVAKKKREDRDAAGWAKLYGQAMDKTFIDSRKRLTDQRKMAEETARNADGLRGMAKNLGLVGAAAGVAGIALDEFFGAKARAIALAKRSDAQVPGMMDFVSALPEGPEGARLHKEVVAMGAKHGMAPGAATSLAGPLYATSDKDGSGALSDEERAAFNTHMTSGAMLTSVGVDAGDATNMILAGDNQGVDGAATASKLLKAAAIGKRGAAEFSKSASAISQYENLDTGLAVATALSASELNPGVLPTRVKDVQMVLSSAQDKGDFATTHGLAGLSQAEKIEKLKAAAAQADDVKTFTDDFINQGLNEGQATSLGMLIQQSDLYSTAAEQLSATTGADLLPEINKNRDNAATGPYMLAARAKAIHQQADLFGDDVPEAQDVRAAALARGAELRRYGGGRAVNEEGEEKPFSLGRSSRGNFSSDRGFALQTKAVLVGGAPFACVFMSM